MGDILTQEEINELINALNKGELDVEKIKESRKEKKVRNYDFNFPEKFAKDQIKTLQFINENYARILTSFLTGYLRTLVHVEVAFDVDSLLYKDFSNSLPSPLVLAVVDFNPLPGQIIIELDPSIAFAMVDRILGGKGSPMEKVREFTEIELAILERVINLMLERMREPWENIIAIRPRLDKIETNIQFAQIASPNDVVALVTMNAKVGEAEGMINICIPHAVVEPVITKLSTRIWFTRTEKENPKENREVIENRIAMTEIPIRAILGRSVISVADVLELQCGDIIPLGTSVNDDLEILVGNLKKFRAKPGVRRNRVSVKITEIIAREDDL